MLKLSYNKLWKILIDRNMKKKDLQEIAEISSSSISKLKKGSNITTDVLLKICHALNCKLDDIVEIIDEESKGE